MITIRALSPKDADALCEIRLTALRKDGCYFTANLEEESAMTKAQWEAAATETTGQVMIGAFDNDQLVGIVGAKKWDKDPEGKTVYWRATYVVPKFRHLSIGKALCASLDEWSLAQGFKQVVYTVHPDNTNSIGLSRKIGAQERGRENLRFADGSFADAIWFQKPLRVMHPSCEKPSAFASSFR